MGTRTRLLLAETQAKVEELAAQVAAEDAVLAQTTPAVRDLAVALHAELCPDDHPSLQCRWYAEDPVAADDPEKADWTAPFHAEWLTRTRGSLATAKARGWGLTPPGSSDPLSPPTAVK